MQNKSYGQLLTGLLLLVLGTGWLLDGLNIIDFGDLAKTYWPLAIVAVGLISIIGNARNWLTSLVIVAVGVALQLRELDILNFNMWSLIWPVALIVLAFSILFRGSWNKPKDDSEDAISAIAIFSGQNIRSVSDKFKGGEITAAFGGVDLDLRDANIEGSAQINVFTMFGGVDIKVPEGWQVRVSGLPLFGGWEDKTKKTKDAKAAVLKINATCAFGGFTVGHKYD
jgi:predicted membrane protein